MIDLKPRNDTVKSPTSRFCTYCHVAYDSLLGCSGVPYGTINGDDLCEDCYRHESAREVIKRAQISDDDLRALHIDRELELI